MAAPELDFVFITAETKTGFPPELDFVFISNESNAIVEPTLEYLQAEIHEGKGPAPMFEGAAAQVQKETKVDGIEMIVQSPVIFPAAVDGVEMVMDAESILFWPEINEQIQDQEARVGDLYSYTFPADAFIIDPRSLDQTMDYTATKSDGNPLPSWLTFNGATRTFEGTPQTSDVGTFTIKLTATVNPSTDMFFTMTVNQGYSEPLFPTGISYGSSGGPGFKTNIMVVDSGAENRVSRWTDARRQYNAVWAIKEQPTRLTELISFYIARRGAAEMFRYWDPLDDSTAEDHTSAPSATDQIFGTGDGTTKQFQLYKTYEESPVVRSRNITKPIGGTILVSVDDTPLAEAGNWSIDTSTGIITFTVAPAQDEVLKWGGRFHVPCRFGEGADQLLSMTVESFRTGSSIDIPIVEVREEDQATDEFHFGGATALSIDADVQLSVSMGRVITIDAGAVTDLEAILPPVANLTKGGPYFFIQNKSINFLRVVAEQDAASGDEIANLQENEVVVCCLGVDSSGNKVWIGF